MDRSEKLLTSGEDAQSSTEPPTTVCLTINSPARDGAENFKNIGKLFARSSLCDFVDRHLEK